MTEIQKVYNFDDFAGQECNQHGLIVGNFDGVHVGHKSLLKSYINRCQKLKIEPVLLTYKQHPWFYLNQNNEKHLILNKTQNYKHLFELGIVKIVEIDFLLVYKMEAEGFLEFLNKKLLRLKLLFLGHDSSIGCDKKHASELVSRTSLNFKFEVENDVEKCEDLIVSSTLIRENLLAGNIELVNKFLERNYCLNGKVVRGKGIGSRQLYPTLNLQVDKKILIPKNGVYATFVFMDSRKMLSVTNIGHNPTVDENKDIKIETYVLDEEFIDTSLDLNIYFLGRIRDEKKFDSFDALKKQITLDIAHVKKHYGKN